MEGPREEQQSQVNAARASRDSERRGDERRKQACEGYCYIEMVGWMDRRESVRRDDNGFC